MSSRLLVPVLAVTILVVSGFIILLYMGSGSLETNTEPGKTVLLDFVLLKCVNPVSVENAGWQISILVANHGTRELRIHQVYLNMNEVDLYGLVHGDSLPDSRKTGTSVSKDGLILRPGETRNLFVWVGDELFTHGTQVVIHFNDPNSVTLMKTITLT
jgi:hypothetical protein